jgi:hypothetical protein
MILKVKECVLLSFGVYGGKTDFRKSKGGNVDFFLTKMTKGEERCINISSGLIIIYKFKLVVVSAWLWFML